MGIENEIQQPTSFRNEYHKVTVNLLFSSNWLVEKLKHHLEAADITPQQYNILRILRGCETPLSTLKIRERMLDKMSDTSRIVERLMKKGLVAKKVSATDKRLVDVTISQKGLAVLSKLDEQSQKQDAIVGNLSDTEAQTLNSLLDKMREKA
ncbi:MAG: MarR family transcriptional regulator [Segetibacter sp.]|nr:MarR family transcriptional regulator [Segetibacter sp.]